VTPCVGLKTTVRIGLACRGRWTAWYVVSALRWAVDGFLKRLDLGRRTNPQTDSARVVHDAKSLRVSVESALKPHDHEYQAFPIPIPAFSRAV
jgi:hypothetical protein